MNTDLIHLVQTRFNSTCLPMSTNLSAISKQLFIEEKTKCR
jgi:hypothetical protein